MDENYATLAGYSCANEYGDPARLNHVSHLMAAVAGYHFSIAVAALNPTTGLA